ncbi:MAG: hypothetical protein JOZ51_08125 [Chloroflexi bacterium]|nr:hypothetical protein [Chloroflexota bacterium]
MKIEHTHHVDAGEPDERGRYEYYYEYDLFVFSEAGVSVVARSYSDMPGEAHFLRIEIGDAALLLKPEDFRRPLVIAAVKHLRALGKHELSWLSGCGNGYEAVRT